MERTSKAYAIPLNSAWEPSVHPVADPWWLWISPLIGLIAGSFLGPLFLKKSTLPVVAGSAVAGTLIMFLIVGPQVLMLVAPKKYYKLR